MNGEKRDNRQTGLLEKAFLNVLVHSDGGREDARADVWEARKLEEALHGAIFAERAVKYWEDYVNHHAGPSG